jgi:hypothetical protein
MDILIRAAAAITAIACFLSLFGVISGSFDIYGSLLVAILLIIEWVRTRPLRGKP